MGSTTSVSETTDSKRIVEWEDELQRSLSMKVECYESIPSTMDVARTMGSKLSLGEWGVVLTKTQLAGRGRQGRQWNPADDAFYGTFVVSSSKDISHFSGLSLTIGVCIAEILHEIGVPVSLKWPNDILSLDGKKLGGILIELVAVQDAINILIGVGINLYRAPAGLETSCGLQDINPSVKISPVEFCSLLGKRLQSEFQIFINSGLKTFRNRWLKLAPWIGREVRVRQNADTFISGVVKDLGEKGSLILLSGKETIEVHAGEVFV